MQFEELPMVLQPESLPYTSGIERLPDGVLHVAVLTHMPGVAPKMIRWWFGEYMETTEHYKRWHPRDHVWMDWEDKAPGTHVGAKHLVHEYIGGRLQKLRIAFVPPNEFLGEAIDENPDIAAICAYPGMLERPIDTGRMAHVALSQPWGCDLHSRFWLGEVRSRASDRVVERIGNRGWVRRRLASDTMGRALLVHCHEEMMTLASFLPELYASTTSAEIPNAESPNAEE